MRKTKILAALAAALLLAACGGQPEPKAQPAQPAAKVEAPAQPAAPAEAPAAQPVAQPVEGASKVLAKPVFIDFYAPW